MRENIKIKRFMLFSLTIISLIFYSINITEANKSKQALNGKKLVEEKCTICHSIGQINKAKKNNIEWRQTVDRMIRKGLQINEEERKTIIEYLLSKSK